MLDALDVRTLLVVVGIVILLAAFGMARFASRFPRFPGLAWIAGADLLLAIGILLVVSRDVAPAWLSTVVANLFAVAGLLLNAEGLRRHVGGEWPWWSRPYVLFLVHVPLVLWFTYVDYDVRMRVLSHTGFTAWVLAGVAIALWRSPARSRMRFVVAAFALFAGWMAFRWGLALAQAPIPSFMGAGGIHALGLIGYAVFVLVKDAGILQEIVQRSLDEMEQQARTDPLTGLLNRRAFGDVAARAMAQARRRGQPLSVVLVDIDHFKQINDVHGHATGDAVLVDVARRLESQVRAGDACARFGGEEFLVLLPDTAAAQAVTVAEKLRSALQSSPTVAGLPLTASFGVAGSEGLDALDRVLEGADRALYRAKAAGRNRVEWA